MIKCHCKASPEAGVLVKSGWCGFKLVSLSIEAEDPDFLEAMMPLQKVLIDNINSLLAYLTGANTWT